MRVMNVKFVGRIIMTVLFVFICIGAHAGDDPLKYVPTREMKLLFHFALGSMIAEKSKAIKGQIIFYSYSVTYLFQKKGGHCLPPNSYWECFPL